MSYDLTFINGAGSRLFIAIKFYQPDECGQYGRPWGTRGWYVLELNEEAEVLESDNRYFYYYAESADGRVWSGDSQAPVYYPGPFDSCVSIGSSEATDIFMRLRDFEVSERSKLT
jgi:hypothetical protein